MKCTLPLTLSEMVLVNGMRAVRDSIRQNYGSSDEAWRHLAPLAAEVNKLLNGVPNDDAAWAVAAVLQTILRVGLEVSLDA